MDKKRLSNFMFILQALVLLVLGVYCLLYGYSLLLLGGSSYLIFVYTFVGGVFLGVCYLYCYFICYKFYILNVFKGDDND